MPEISLACLFGATVQTRDETALVGEISQEKRTGLIPPPEPVDYRILFDFPRISPHKRKRHLLWVSRLTRLDDQIPRACRSRQIIPDAGRSAIPDAEGSSECSKTPSGALSHKAKLMI